MQAVLADVRTGESGRCAQVVAQVRVDHVRAGVLAVHIGEVRVLEQNQIVEFARDFRHFRCRGRGSKFGNSTPWIALDSLLIVQMWVLISGTNPHN